MVTIDGRVKVLDFGLAKLTPRGDAGIDDAMPTAALTDEGQIARDGRLHVARAGRGKRRRSPLGHLLAGRACCTRWRRVSGRSRRQPLVDCCRRSSRTRRSRSHEVKPGCPRELGRIIRRCLTKEPTGATSRPTTCATSSRSCGRRSQVVHWSGLTQRRAVCAAGSRSPGLPPAQPR